MTDMTNTIERPGSPGSPEPPRMATTRAPAVVRASNPLTTRLLRLGAPMGPNLLLTVRGRASGLERTAPVAVVEIDGRRWVIGAYGDVQWTRNLRAAGQADVERHGRREHVTARELDREEALDWFSRVLPAYIRSFPWLGRVFARLLFGAIAPVIRTDPAAAAATRPVFELMVAPRP
jgi:deazaflavin-dependent oxidoreductase (nitroreductase family)